MMTVIDDKEVMAELDRRLKLAGSQTKLAPQLGISIPYLNQIINGERGVSEDVAYKLGFVREIRYVRQA